MERAKETILGDAMTCSAQYDAIEREIAKRVRDRPRGHDGPGRYRFDLAEEFDEDTGEWVIEGYTVDTCEGAPRVVDEETVLRQILAEEAPWVSQDLFDVFREVTAGITCQADWDPPTDQIALSLVLLLARARERAETSEGSRNPA